MAVIGDVAKYAGVSKSTVSKFLNKPHLLSDEYRERITEAVEALNYVPNNIARSIRLKKINQLAMIVPDIVNPFYSELFSEMRSYANKLGYSLILYTTDDDIEELNKYIDNINNIFADGIIFCFLDEDGMIRHIDNLHEKIPITLLSWDINITKYNSVVFSLNNSIFQISKYVISLGHKRIAFINGPEDSRISKEKLDGFSRAMKSAGIEICNEYLKYGRNRISDGYHNTSQLMHLVSPPTAIISANDSIAVGCIKYLTQHNFKVPEDVVVTGHDGIQLSYIYDPSITTNIMPISEMCNTAVNLLINKIQKPASKIRQAIFTSTLVEGKSTNPNAPNLIDL